MRTFIFEAEILTHYFRLDSEIEKDSEDLQANL